MSRKSTILLSLLLSLPIVFFLLHHYFYHSPGLHPTGFTVDENVLYMSYAHQYLDQDQFSFFYSNPFDGDPASAQIYFQPVNFLFAVAMHLGMNPGLCFSLFGLIMAVACIYLGIRIIQHLLPGYRHQSWVAVLFTWGGGLTAITGLLASGLLSGYSYEQWMDGIFTADPANGWWGLNWGRTLFIPLEAFYHFLFLLNIYLVLKKRWIASVLVALFLSISHPFTGIEQLLILLGWLFIEKIIYKNKTIPYWYAGSILLVTVFHAWYYLVYLNSFGEHRQLFSQYSAGWTYSLYVAIPAYCIVAGLCALTAWKSKTFRGFLSSPQQRLFLCWAVIAFLLSKHEWFIKPMQPIHFTRGYTWAGLFLLAIPGLVWLFGYLQARAARKWILAGFIVIFLSDNLLWTTNILRKKETTEWEGHITKDTKEVLDYLRTTTRSNDLLVGDAPLVNYLANVYTSVNTWESHPYNTPNKEQRSLQTKKYLETWVKPPEWKDRRVIVVLKRAAIVDWKFKVAFENGSYYVVIP